MIAEVIRRIWFLLNRRRLERALDEELAFHREMMERDGRVRFGDPLRLREQAREVWGWRWLDDLWRDLHHALRALCQSPGFSVTAIVVLGLGIGGNTAVFTLLDQVMLRPLPVRSPDELVMIWTTGPSLGSNQGTRASSYPMYQDFQQRAPDLSHVFCRYYTALSISLGGENERVTGELVSGNYFGALGVGPEVGRVFSPEEDDQVYKGHPVVVLSHQYWVARFAADPGVVGRKILVNNYPMTIVGVSAAGFSGIDPVRSPQIRVPIQMKPLMTPGSDQMGNRRNQWVQIFARLRPGTMMRSAEASLQPLLASILRTEAAESALQRERPATRDRFLARQVRMESAATGYSDLRQDYAKALPMLMSMVGLVLLVACLNVASLLLARGSARQKEIAVRLAIGASRGQLVRQLLVESVVLSVAGTIVGLCMSVAMIQGLVGFLPAKGMLLTLRTDLDVRAFAFAAVLAILTGLTFGLAPAWRAVRVDLRSALKGAEGAVVGGPGAIRLRRGLVIAQVTFSFLLLIAAGLFARTLNNLERTDPGFRDIDRLITFQVDAARSGYSLPSLKAFYERIEERVGSVPGVTSAGYAWIPVLSGREADWDVEIEGRPALEGDDRQTFVNYLSPGYRRAMGLALEAGRDFDAGDNDSGRRVTMVNRAFAARFFEGANPVGRHVGIDGRPGAVPNIEVVGVVENSLNEGPRQGVRRQIFLPFAQATYPYAASFYVRTTADLGATSSALRRIVQDLDAAVPIYELKTLGAQRDETLGTERMTTVLSGTFGVLATLLAAVGLYGVTALSVVRRTREIGLRIALGARRRTVLGMVLKEALGLLAVGLVAGVPCAYWLNRHVSSQLFGVGSTDLGTAAIASLVLSAVATCAGVLPARRAWAIDPMRALRGD
jgi:predicted permease